MPHVNVPQESELAESTNIILENQKSVSKELPDDLGDLITGPARPILDVSIIYVH